MPEIPFRTNVVIVREIPKYNGSDTVFFVYFFFCFVRSVLLLNLFLLFVVCFCIHPAYPCQKSGFSYGFLVVPILFIILVSVLCGGLFVLPHDFLSYFFFYVNFDLLFIFVLCLLSHHIEEFWKMVIPIIGCYMQLQWPNSTLRYSIFSIH